MRTQKLPLLVTPQAVHATQDDPAIIRVYVGPLETYASAHLPGATQVEYAALLREGPPGGLLPNMEQLADVLGQAGITPAHHVVAYDDSGNGRAARLIWTLDCLGHTAHSLLNGGLPAWLDDSLPVVSGIASANTAPPYPAEIKNPQLLSDIETLVQHLDDDQLQVLDARTPAEHAGLDVRAARGGHIPGAINLDWTMLWDQDNACRLKPLPELQQLHEERGIDPAKKVVVHCQTHHRSALSYVVLKALGYPEVSAYAGSWAEWGNHPTAPIASAEQP
ncbi:MAG: sulfurtransferase [Gammaproteobacteria bacterium]|nr:sulfurtransferase [Gammaproteobacteria bacterium]